MRDASWGKQGEFSVVSGYAGIVDLHGKRWAIKVWDDINGKLVEPEYFSIRAATTDPNFAEDSGYWSIPKSLFVGGRCYELSFSSQSAGGQMPSLTCALTEKQVALGALKIEGTLIKRLAFSNKELLVFPELTDDVTQVPAGEYECKTCVLEGTDGATLSPKLYERAVNVLIEQSRENIFRIGGPLKQSVEITREGVMLDLTYHLTGAGGETYDVRQLSNYDYSKMPSFVVYKGQTQLASGQFEYG
jgi:hypothetical protein